MKLTQIDSGRLHTVGTWIARDPWTMLTGHSTTIVVGLAVDLWRLVLHEARQALSPRPKRKAVHRWSGVGVCGSACGAGSCRTG